MEDFPTKKITIYHKNKQNVYERYVKEASIRNTSMLNQKNYGFSSNDNAIIRVFDVEGYKNSWDIIKGDIIVNEELSDEIETTHPLNELSDKYGRENVFKVNSINVLIFDDEDIEELNHVKIGAI